ncbi:Membrane associated DnaJ chaperone-like protein [Pyrenophora tritici-repentis]|nr:Membrane associated DnaJ chaperone-like protein [Pyrenophora tritici-repentis]KAI0588853.1 Membrane associated DnaJ chaperone-like protein [Pyrenophora tritici-repentis]KAI0614893.1 Membrane associated DnaJ chaperone-like protein [Pyrenophora tritici-repentis]KAI0624690.1 Membrane associated DnaJ chaperone-like protein [Pyrenophora tritici-repentis]
MVNLAISWDLIGPFLVWQYLIPFAAGWAQTVLYSIFIRAGDPKPQPGSPRFIKHRRNILVAVYAAYFAFTIYEVDFNLQHRSNAYNDLGVPIDVSQSALNTHFRKLTLQYHPDKIGRNVDRDTANDYYVRLRHAKDIILDPAKRSAYDRFGPWILENCQRCSTISDYTNHGLLAATTNYGVLTIFLFGANALGFLTDGAYWRYLGILAVATFEVRTAMRPDHPAFLYKYLNPLVTSTNLRLAYLPFEIVLIVKKAAVSLAQFLTLLMPLYRMDAHKPVKPIDDSDETRHKQLDRLGGLVDEINKDANRLLELESIPYRDNERAKTELRDALKKYMVQNVVHQEREVRNAMGQVMMRKRTGVPHGAVGTK